MNENQIKPIETPEQIKNITPTYNQNEKNEKKIETIKELPTWNLEPPIEIKR